MHVLSCRAFSTFHQQGYSTSSSLSAENMAKSMYDFVVKHMRDPNDRLCQSWYNTVTREGNPWDVRKMVYQQLFVLYAFR
jgi:mannose/cellobiose epimerase-like protein (N-acyl-D-glucosamine 2-epimerase family)